MRRYFSVWSRFVSATSPDGSTESLFCQRVRAQSLLVSIELDVADHLGPLHCLLAHVVGHLLGRTLQQLGASVDHLLADDRVGDGSNVSLVATSTSPSK